MKHQTNRIRKNNTTKKAPVQPSVGHEQAISLPAEIRKQAIAVVAEWRGETPEELSNRAINSVLLDMCEEMHLHATHPTDPDRKAKGQKFFSRLYPLLKSLGIEDKTLENGQTPNEKTAAQKRGDLFEARCLLDEAVRAAKALQMLMFNSLHAENVQVWKNDLNYLAAGLQTLLQDSDARLEQAHDAVNKAAKS